MFKGAVATVAEVSSQEHRAEALAGLFLAGVRNIKPHPVGFKFHAVMVINSAQSFPITFSDDEAIA